MEITPIPGIKNSSIPGTTAPIPGILPVAISSIPGISTSESNEKIKHIAEDWLYIPKTLEMLTPMLSVIPLQLFAYYMGVLCGYDVDRPRNLAKSVTVE